MKQRDILLKLQKENEELGKREQKDNGLCSAKESAPRYRDIPTPPLHGGFGQHNTQ